MQSSSSEAEDKMNTDEPNGETPSTVFEDINIDVSLSRRDVVAYEELLAAMSEEDREAFLRRQQSVKSEPACETPPQPERQRSGRKSQVELSLSDSVLSASERHPSRDDPGRRRSTKEWLTAKEPHRPSKEYPIESFFGKSSKK